MPNHLFDFFRSNFPADSARTFIELPDGTTISYAEIGTRTGKLANLFQSLGVKPGDRIAVQAEKTVEGLFVYLAALRAGAVYLPLNPGYTIGEVRYFLGDAEPTLFICRPQDEAAMRDAVGEIGVAHLLTLGADGQGSLTDAARDASPDFADADRAADDLAAILYTSGTTGRSKGAMLSHANLRSNAEVLRSYWRFTKHDRLLHALPIFHTHGLFVATNTVLASGASMIFLPKFDVREVMRLLPRATTMMGVPTFYSRLLGESDFTRAAASHMRVFISGSAPLSADTHREFSARTGHAILERYGMTEINMHTSNPYCGDRVPGSVGFPLPGGELRIADMADGAILPQGEIGIIEVRGPNVFKGYWRMPEKTVEEFRPDGFFITGDMGRIDERGYVHIVGREKDLIIAGGLNIYPAEVEAALDELPQVTESAVIGVPHPDLGEVVVAIVKPAPGSGADEAEIVAGLADRLARFKQPRHIVFVDELPRNAMGKVQKKMLREEYGGLFTSLSDVHSA